MSARDQLIIYASVLLFLNGCVKTDVDSREVRGTISATIEEAQTRATLNYAGASGNNFLVWQAEDSISLFDGVSNIKCTLTSGAGDKNAVFNPLSTPAEAATYYAVYPYSREQTCENGTLKVLLPESGINMMVARQSTKDIRFKNLCSYIRFTISGTENQAVEKIVIEGKDGQAVAGEANVTFSDEEPVLSFNPDKCSSSLSIDFTNARKLSSEGFTFCAAVPPVFDDGFKATVFLDDGTYQILESNTTIGRNEIVNMPRVAFAAYGVARVGDTQYSSIGEAFAAANTAESDVTLTLLTDISTSGPLEISNPDAKVTLDLAGKTLSLTNTLTVSSEVEILDGKDGSGSISATDEIAVTADAGACLTISAGTLISSAEKKYTLNITNGAKAIIEGEAHIISQKYRCIYLYGSATAQTEASLEIRGGWIRCAEGQCCIVTTRTTTSAEHYRCFLNVTGGHFSHAGKDYDSAKRCLYRGYSNCTAVVSGGFFDTNDIYRYYNGKPNNYTAEGCSISSTETDFPLEYSNGYTYYIKRDGSKEALDRAIRKLFDETGARNLAVIAYKGGKEVYSATFGYRCAEEGNIDTLEMHDIFRIASISKCFTAAAMMLLVDKGLINLDTPINDYLARLPEGKRFTVTNDTYPDVPITARMLLNHTSTVDGTPYYGEDCFLNIKCTNKEPGKAYSYSNMGSVLAGAIVEIASGESLDVFVKKNLLDKVVMPHSGHDPSLIDTLNGPKFVYIYNASGKFHYTDDAYANLMDEERRKDYIPGYDTGLVKPAGNVKTNAYELCRWMRTLQSGGLSPDGVRVIPEEMVYMMHNSTSEANDNYGFFLGRSSTVFPGVTRCGHTGSYYGVHTTMFYGMRSDGKGNALPVIPGSAEDWGVITLASGNDSEEGSLGGAITELLYYNLLEGDSTQK